MPSTRTIGCVVAACAAACLSGSAVAADLYSAVALVTGRGEESRASGYADCLAKVLVKVAGDPRLARDPRLSALAARAASLVVGDEYRDRMAGIPIHDEQGSRDRPYILTARFDPAGVDVALRALGREPWHGPRPRLATLIGVDNGAARYVLAAEGEQGRDQRDALAEAGALFGLGLALPSQATVALAYERLAAARADELASLTHGVDGEIPLVGLIVWRDDELGWAGEWRLRAGDATYEWRIRGVGFDKAFQSAVGGAAQILSGNGAPE